MLTALEPYLRSAILEGRWHSWLAEPGGCASLEIVQWVPGRQDPPPRRAWIHSVFVEPSFRRRGIARQLTQTIHSALSPTRRAACCDSQVKVSRDSGLCISINK